MIDFSEAAKAEIRAYKRDYMKKWRRKNPDKVAANNRNYWERRAGRAVEAAEEVENEPTKV